MSNHNTTIKLMDNIEDRLYRYRAKRLRFLINGDKFFTGINYALNTEKIRSYDALLNDLTRVLMDHIKLCKGVRYMFNLEGNLISSLTDFQDGNTYICSSIETFISTDYRINNGMLNWLVRNSACISSSRNVVSKRSTNNNISSSTANTNPRQMPPTIIETKTTSQNANSRGDPIIGNNNSSNDNNNISHPSNQSKSPKSNHHSTPTFASAAKVTPKKTVDNKFSHYQKSNTPTTQQATRKPINSATPTTATNSSTCTTPTAKAHNNTANSDSDVRKPMRNQSPHITNSASGKWAQNRSMFGFEVMEKYDIGRPIGDGHFSIVYCCMNKSTQEFCALKLIDKLKCRGKDDMIYNEVKILKQLNHPNIVKLIEEFDYSKQLYLILELVQDGDLFDAISSVTKFSEVHVATMIHNLSSALSYLHRQGIVHRDIKPENLLISVQEDGSQSVKLADFGLAVELGDNPLYSVCGTAFYVSPEMLNETGYDYKVDVWSTGVICFILLCGYPPFTSENESNQDELFDSILAGDFQFAPTYWSKISQHAKNIIKCMLTVDPEKRYTADQVFNHPWTAGTSNNFEGINPLNISRKIALQSQ